MPQPSTNEGTVQRGSEASLATGSGSGSGPPGSRFLRRLGRILRVLAISTVALALLAVLGMWLVIRHYEQDLPSIGDLKGNYNPPQVTRVLARDATLLAEIFTERRTVIPISSLPAHVKLAVLAAEDAGFYEHEGLNYWGMLRAFLVNLRS